MLVENQAAYILHTRHFKDDDALLDCYSCDHGRFRAIMPGLFKSSKNKAYLRGLIQPFTALSLSYKNQSELKKITQVEAASASLSLQGRHLFAGLYLNELLLRLLPLEQASNDLFALYIQTLGKLLMQQELEPLLRQFELQLLTLLGVAIDLRISQGKPLEPQAWYFFDAQTGLRLATQTDTRQQVFHAQELLALSLGEFTSPEQLRAAKRLMRYWLGFYLGSKPLASRTLFGK